MAKRRRFCHILLSTQDAGSGPHDFSHHRITARAGERLIFILHVTFQFAMLMSCSPRVARQVASHSAIIGKRVLRWSSKSIWRKRVSRRAVIVSTGVAKESADIATSRSPMDLIPFDNLQLSVCSVAAIRQCSNGALPELGALDRRNFPVIKF